MKRVWIAIALLLVSGILCVSEYTLINKQCDEYTSIIKKADEHVKNDEFEKAVKECKKAEKQFTKSDSIMNVFLIHGDVDDVTNNIAMLKKYAQYECKSEFLSLSAKTKRQLLSLQKSELPMFENIF